MLKKLLKMAMTFVVLVAAYGGYSRGFAFLASHIARPRTVPDLPIVATQSRSLKDAIALAVAAFGPDHWAVKAELHYYDELRGYWMYYRNQERLDDGKTWEFTPVAIIIQSSKGKGRELKTITGKKARLNFNRPFDVSKPGDEPAYVTHALIQGDVRIRADKGTPSIADDLVIGPLKDSLEFDEKRAQITSQGDERIVLVEKGTTVTGLGLTMDLRRKSPVTDPWEVAIEGAPALPPTAGFEGVKTITLHSDVTIDVENVSQSGIVPGGSKVVATTTKDGKTAPAKVEPRPGHIQCDGPMLVELPRNRPAPRIGPPAPPEPTFAYFDRNVRLQQGSGADLDQLDSDHFEAMLLPPDPAEKTKAQAAKDTEPKKKSAADAALAAGPATKDQTKADPATDAAEEGGSSLSNLTLRRAKATGHAVWLQSTAQHMVAYGNYLRYEKFGGNEPDCTYFYGDKYTDVVKTDVYTTGKEIGKPRSIETIRTKDITIYRYPPGGLAPSVIARGPGTQETRPAGSDLVERSCSWLDEARMVSKAGSDERRVTLLGHPRVRSETQGDMTADKEIVFDLEPKDKGKDKKTEARVISKDGKPVPPRDPKTIAESTPEPSTGDSMRIKNVRAVGNVLLVTKETIADPTAKPPVKGVSRREMRARDLFTAKFIDVPADPTPPQVAAVPAATKPAEAEPSALAQGDPAKPAPPSPAPEPPMTAIADTVDAIVLRKAGSENSQVSEAKLVGAAEVHQDPKEGKTIGSDMTGGVIFLRNGGENRLWVQAQQGTSPDLASAVTDGRNIQGPIVTFDQARDYAWVAGWGRLEMEQGETDFLDGSAPVGNEVAATEAEDKMKTAAPKKKKGPLIINWGTGPDDKTAMMHFHGRTTNPDGSPGPAQAIFYSHVRARTDDSSGDAEKLTATFDAPIPFVRLKADPEEAKTRKKGEKPPGPQIATILFQKNADVIARQIDPETGFLKDKKHIIHDEIFYEKTTGEFTAKNGPGEVFLYTTSSDDKDAAAPGPMASDRRTIKPTSARVEDPKAKKVPTTQPQLTLTHVIFQKQMIGRFTPPKDAKPGDYNNVYFNGSVETMMAKVKDENATLDPDNPPDDFYRLVSREMTVNIEPPPVKGKDAKDRTLLDAWGDPEAQTRQKTIKGDQITYDSLSELTYVYGGAHGVNITNQDGAGQPYTNGRGKTVKHNHKTGETQVIDPKTFAVIQPNTGTRSVVVPIQATPRNVGGLAAPNRPFKTRDPFDPVLKARQLRLPPRSDKERRGFSGR